MASQDIHMTNQDTHPIGSGRRVKCLFCSSNQDYLCEVHDHMFLDNNLSDAKFTLAVVGDGTPRANNCVSDELSLIITVERPSDLFKYLTDELEPSDRDDFKILMLITPELLEVLTKKDVLDIFRINNEISAVCVIFQANEDREKFITLYKSFSATPGEIVNYFARPYLDELRYVVDYMRSEYCKAGKQIIELFKV